IGKEGGRTAALVYTGWFVLTALVWNALWHCAASPARRPPVLAVSLDSEEVRRIRRAYRLGPLVYGLALLVSLWVPVLGVALCGVVALGLSLPPGAGETVQRSP